VTRVLSKSALCAAALTLFASAPPVSAQESARALSAVTAHSYAPTSTRSLPIFYDHALAGQGFPNALVKARIAGHEAIFIVDSGASVNVLADWYVEVAGIPANATDSTAQGSGGKATAERLAHRLQGHWSDGQRFSLNEAVVVAFPPLFKSLHLGGLVSPQLLAPAGMAAVLDLKIPSLQFVPFARALSDLRRSKAPTVPLDLTQPCRNADSKLVNRQYLAPVTTAGVTDLMLVDTGATTTIFSKESKISHAIESRSELGPRSEGVGGEVNGRRIVRDVQLLRGGRIVALNPSIGEVSAPCDAKGILGMDALRSCLLILGDNEMAFSCR
jgi:Aspartyl protease